jgi:hypothetical protein
VIRKLFMLTALLLLLPAVALAAPGNPKAKPAGAVKPPNPSQTCTAHRTALTAPVFNTTYGKNENDSNAFGKCVSSQQKTAASAKTSASASCRAERDDTAFPSSHGGKSFAAHYGTSDNDKNAFGKCVAQQTKTTFTQLSQKTMKAAKACWAQRQASRATFDGRWKNFGECVSKDARTM